MNAKSYAWANVYYQELVVPLSFDWGQIFAPCPISYAALGRVLSLYSQLWLVQRLGSDWVSNWHVRSGEQTNLQTVLLTPVYWTPCSCCPRRFYGLDNVKSRRERWDSVYLVYLPYHISSTLPSNPQLQQLPYCEPHWVTSVLLVKSACICRRTLI